MAEAFRRIAESLPDEAQHIALQQAEQSMARSRWLDLQVAHVLEMRDQDDTS